MAITPKSYFHWLTDIISDFENSYMYNKLLKTLFKTKYRWTISMDSNRASYGLRLRDIYIDEFSYRDYEMPQECSVLEMLVALAYDMETALLYDPKFGDRTSIWFWFMLDNLGLLDYTDDNYDEDSVIYILDTFMDNEYQPDGCGGLFRFDDPYCDIRDLEIWRQVTYFVNNFNEGDRK